MDEVLNLDIPEEPIDDVPVVPRIDKKNLVKAHGKKGRLIISNQRYGILGWILFFLSGLLVVGLVLVIVFFPRVIVVDTEGRMIGEIDFYEPVKRLDDELLTSGMKFLENYMSMNSETIFKEYAMAMNLMSPELLAETKKSVVEDGYLQRIVDAKSRSTLEFDKDEDAPYIIQRTEAETRMRFRGTLTIIQKDRPNESSEFDITLFVAVVPTTSLRPSGIEINALIDN